MSGERVRRAPDTRLSSAADVAAAAGVSTATVSRTFNTPHKVAAPIRARVQDAAERLGWTANAAGRALASSRSYIAGAVIPTLDDQIFAAQVGAMQAAFATAGITLFLGCSNYDQTQALVHVRAMLARGVEALALVGEAYPEEVFTAIKARRVPYTVTYTHRPDSPHHCVGFSNRDAFHAITRHLLDLGHRRFGLIIQPTQDNDRVIARVAGVRDALDEQGLGLRLRHVHEGPWSIAFGRTSLRAIMQADGPRPTAIVCGNDYLAIGALLEAQALGIRVPTELSITGFDDVAMASQTTPGLTTMWIDNAEIGRLAAQDLLACLAGETPAPRPPLATTLIGRGSTAVVPHGQGG
jgi:LacI family transcriptional regulator